MIRKVLVALAADTTPWPTFQGNPQRSGKSIANGPSGASVHPLWTYKAKSIVRNEPSIAPDGSVYIGESTCPLAALSSGTGTRNFCTTVGVQTAQSTATVGNELRTLLAGHRSRRHDLRRHRPRVVRSKGQPHVGIGEARLAVHAGARRSTRPRRSAVARST